MCVCTLLLTCLRASSSFSNSEMFLSRSALGGRADAELQHRDDVINDNQSQIKELQVPEMFVSL